MSRSFDFDKNEWVERVWTLLADSPSTSALEPTPGPTPPSPGRWFFSERSPKRPRVAVEYLLEDPQDRNVCPVAIRIVRRGREVGRDRGAVWFQDGALYYSGERTSFILGGENVLPQSRWSVFNDGEGIALPAFALPLNIDGVATYVSFQPLSHSDRSASYGQELLFMRRLAPLRDRPKPGHGPRQWPPIA